MTIEEESALGKNEVANVIKSGDIVPLDDIHSIEYVLYKIKGFEKDIKDLNELKRKRSKSITREIEKIGKRINFLEALILATLKEHGEKKVRFPDVGSVSERKPRVSYEILDQEALLKSLKDEGEYDEIVEEDVSLNIKKNKLNALLLIWDKLEKLPESVKKADAKPSVTIKIESSTDLPDLDNDDESEVGEMDFS